MAWISNNANRLALMGKPLTHTWIGRRMDKGTNHKKVCVCNISIFLLSLANGAARQKGTSTCRNIKAK